MVGASGGVTTCPLGTPTPTWVTVPVWAVHNRAFAREPIEDLRVRLSWQEGSRPATLLLRRRELRAEIDGQPVLLSRQAFLLLEHLILRPGRVCPVSTLRVVVGEEGKTATATRVREIVHRARRAIGDHESRWLRNVRGRGYVWQPREHFNCPGTGPSSSADPLLVASTPLSFRPLSL